VSLREVVARHRVIVCVGSGGVGKTTAAAAIGLWGARQGRRTVVITIDPARRLATSLGLAVGTGAPRDLPADLLARHGIRTPLAAMMLDQKGAWDRLVERHAPNREVRDRVYANAFYQSLSQTFAGSYEFMAVEELAELYEAGGYDLIVVDTPPTKHALDFLEAPRRLDDFLDRRIIRWFVRPYLSATWSGMRMVNRTVNFVLRRLEEVTGISALLSVSEFFTNMSGLFDGFHARVESAYDILRGAETAFVLVTCPEVQVLEEAGYLSHKMATLGMPLKGVVFNRAHAEPAGDGPGRRGGAALAADRDLVERIVTRGLGAPPVPARVTRALVETFLSYQRLARGEARRMAAFTRALGAEIPAVRVPNFAHDVHDIAGLLETHPHLFGENAPRASGE
jgi:anion-transporting  ArsA/GET3 family ATPase